MNAWIEPVEINIPEDFQHLVGGHPLVAQTLIRRGIKTLPAAQAFLDPAHYMPASPADLPGMETAVVRLLSAIQKQETICVWGDFDVDGQTSTSLLVSALRNLQARVVYHIPLRATESHGVNQPVLEKILRGYSQGESHAALGWEKYFAPVSLLLTCDTGVSSHPALIFARNLGVDVIVTDHHELPEELPPALALINPHLLPEGHPLGSLPGVGVVYKLVQALYSQLGEPLASTIYLDLVAMGIVADLALQTADTRYLLQCGLEIMRESRRAGLQSILELAEINPANLNEEHIAFELAPRLNALGRLGDANLAVELLTTDDIGQARLLAVQLEILNNQRKLQTEQVYKGAMAQIERDPGLANTPAIVLANPAWPAGVVGIVASRLVECYQKPVVMIATPEGESGRGSARSVEGINITNALKANASLLTGFGGHRMAAGFSIELQRVDEFRRALNRTLEQEGPSLEPRLQISAIITLPDLTLDFVADLERLAPFGAGNPPLILACLDLHLQSAVTVGREGEHLLATIEDGAGQTQQVIWWQSASWPRPEGMFDLAFKARTVTFRGQRAVQVEWVDYRPASTAVSASQVVFTPDVHNYRQEAHPLPVLTSLVNRGGILVWAEADAVTKLAAHGVPAYPRLELNPSESLAIWTPPPGPETLADVLEKVRPKQIYLFAINPETDQLESFLSQLAGLAKHVIRNEQGDVRLEKLAGALAQREVTIRKGLAWMAAKGFLTCQEIRPGELMLTTGGLVEQPAVRGLSQEIEELLAETRAYRTYYTRASKVIDSLMTSRISA